MLRIEQNIATDRIHGDIYGKNGKKRDLSLKTLHSNYTKNACIK